MLSKFSLNVVTFKITINSVLRKLNTSTLDNLFFKANSIDETTCSVNAVLFFKTNSSIVLNSDGNTFV